MYRRVTVTVSIALLLAFPSSAAGHFGADFQYRWEAVQNLRDALWDIGWIPMRLSCGKRIIAVHFVCSFKRLGSNYVLCYHALEEGLFEVTRYREGRCQQWY